MQHKIRVMFLSMMAICVVFCFGIFYIMLETKMEESVVGKEESDRMVASGNYNRAFENLNGISHLLMLRSGIHDYLSEERVTPAMTTNAVQDIYDVVHTFDIPCYVTIFRQDRRYVNTGSGIVYIDVNGIYFSRWLDDVIERNGGYVIKSNREGFFRIQNDRLITFIRQVNDINTQKPIGYLAISVSHKFFDRIYEGLADESNHFAIYDKSGYLVNTDKETVFVNTNVNTMPEEQIYKGIFREKIVCTSQIKDTDFILVTSSEVNLWSGLSAKFVWGLVVGVILLILCMSYINSYIVHNVTKPIQKLSDSMSKVQTGWLHRVSMKVSDDEIGLLKNSYNAMLLEINHLIEEQINQEKNLQKAELEALQEQIKPHFLYNTLDTIRYFALEGENEKVYEMLETLGSFYRKFLSKGSVDIPLTEEIDIVRNYLKLQKNRYDDIFEDIYEIEEGLENVRVPRLTLQPLVENSIYHGIRPKGESGIIRITVYRKEDVMHIKVYDSGIGMSQEQLKQLIQEGKSSRSFGIKGTVSRIQYYYKTKDVIEVRSEEGEYFEIELKLPLEEERHV